MKHLLHKQKQTHSLLSTMNHYSEQQSSSFNNYKIQKPAHKLKQKVEKSLMQKRMGAYKRTDLLALRYAAATPNDCIPAEIRSGSSQWNKRAKASKTNQLHCEIGNKKCAPFQRVVRNKCACMKLQKKNVKTK